MEKPEIFSRVVVGGRLVYRVHCLDGKDRIVSMYGFAEPAINVNILKNGERYGSSHNLSSNKKLWGVGFREAMQKDFDEVFVDKISAACAAKLPEVEKAIAGWAAAIERGPVEGREFVWEEQKKWHVEWTERRVRLIERRDRFA